MNHLNEERLFELGVTPDDRPTSAEAGHLATCEACAATLADERLLSAELAALPVLEAPVGFVNATQARFEQTQASRHVRHTALAFGLALAAGLLITLPLLGVLIGSAETLVLQASQFVQTVATLGRALTVVVEAVPLVPIVMAAALCTACTIIATFVNRLAVVTAAWK